MLPMKMGRINLQPGRKTAIQMSLFRSITLTDNYNGIKRDKNSTTMSSLRKEEM